MSLDKTDILSGKLINDVKGFIEGQDSQSLHHVAHITYYHTTNSELKPLAKVFGGRLYLGDYCVGEG